MGTENPAEPTRERPEHEPTSGTPTPPTDATGEQLGDRPQGHTTAREDQHGTGQPSDQRRAEPTTAGPAADSAAGSTTGGTAAGSDSGSSSGAGSAMGGDRTEDTAASGAGAESQVGPSRQESFEGAAPIEIDLSVTSGRMTVRLSDRPGVHVEVAHDPAASSPWMSGLSGLVSWVSGQFGTETEPPDIARQAVANTRVDFTGRRLVVQTPKPLPLRPIPLAITVRAPAGSQVTAHSGSADMTITGTAGALDLTTGTGAISAERSDSRVSVKTGSGAVRLGPVLSGLSARTGTGEVEVSSVSGASVLLTGTGDIWLGAVQGDISARTGSGDVTVADAASGKIQLATGSGALRVAVRAGVTAEIDLVSGSANAHSDLEVQDQPPAEPVGLRITGRTGSGEVAVSRAT